MNYCFAVIPAMKVKRIGETISRMGPSAKSLFNTNILFENNESIFKSGKKLAIR
jgi:hypothetical protein